MTTNNNEILRAEQLLRNSDPDLIEESKQSMDEMLQQQQPNNEGKAKFIPLSMKGRTHKPSSGSRMLIENQVPLERLEKMTNCFYEKAFQDETLDKFIHSHHDPHGQRFAKWIHQKLSGSTIWDQDRRRRDLTPKPVAGNQTVVVHDRSSAHAAAWYSNKRPSRDVGRHFQLDECRVWMRLHFWAMRETGILRDAPSFADYYVRFIGHFVSVYESKAPPFARDSLRWSADPNNIREYIQNGRRMNDVLGLSFSEALAQIPTEESNDFEWPYNQTPQDAEA